MAKSKSWNCLPPTNFGGGGGCYPNCRGGIDNRISCEKFMKIGSVKLQLHAHEVLRLRNDRANWNFHHYEPHTKFDWNKYKAETWQFFFTETLCIKMRKMSPTAL